MRWDRHENLDRAARQDQSAAAGAGYESGREGSNKVQRDSWIRTAGTHRRRGFGAVAWEFRQLRAGCASLRQPVCIQRSHQGRRDRGGTRPEQAATGAGNVFGSPRWLCSAVALLPVRDCANTVEPRGAWLFHLRSTRTLYHAAFEWPPSGVAT